MLTFIKALPLMTMMAFAPPLLASIQTTDLDINFSGYHFTQLEEGFQGELSSPAVTIDLGQGERPAYLYALPLYNSEHIIKLSSKIKADEFFYPILLVLNKDFKLNRYIQKDLRIRNFGFDNFGFKSELKVTEEDRYIVIMTIPELIGKSLAFTRTRTSSIPVNSTGTIFVPGPSTTQYERARFSSTPHINVMIPVPGNPEPIKRHTGFYFDLGATSGGDKVANNTTIDPNTGDNGDAYNAGGGALFGAGYSQPISAKYNLLSRGYLGYRYQGGDGTNQGVILEGSLVFTQQYYNLGIGLYGDLNNSVKLPEGGKVNFKDAFGTSLFVEYRAADNFIFGLRFVAIDYESKSGDEYDGTQAGIYMAFEL